MEHAAGQEQAANWPTSPHPREGHDDRCGGRHHRLGHQQEVDEHVATFRPLAEASQRGDLVNLLLMAQTVVATAATVIMAFLGWGLVGQFAALFLASGVLHSGLTWYGIRRYPELLGGNRQRELLSGDGRNREKSVSKSLWSLSWPNLVFNFCSRIGLLTDNIVIALFLGPAAVTSFYLSQRILTLAVTQVQAVGGATWAGLLDLHYRGEREVFIRRLVQVTRLSAVLGTAALLPTAVWNHSLITLWVGSDQYAGAAVSWLAAVNAWTLAVSSVWGWPLSAGGHVRTVLPIIVTSTTVYLVGSLAATALFGLSGPLIGTCAGLTLVSWWWLLLALRRHFGASPRALLGAAVGPALLGVPYGLALFVLSEAVPAHDPSWPRWVGLLSVLGWLAAAAAGYLAAAWFLVVPRAFRREWVDRCWGWLVVWPATRRPEPTGAGAKEGRT